MPTPKTHLKFYWLTQLRYRVLYCALVIALYAEALKAFDNAVDAQMQIAWSIAIGIQAAAWILGLWTIWSALYKHGSFEIAFSPVEKWYTGLSIASGALWCVVPYILYWSANMDVVMYASLSHRL